MAAVVVDTHALVWYVESSPLLSGTALAAIQAAVFQGDPIHVSTVSLVEIVYLTEKGRLPVDLIDRLWKLFQQGNTGLAPMPFTSDMADNVRRIPRAVVPDMPDRMIAATALTLGVSLVTRDPQIQNSGISWIW